jgi:hypothetical protein
VNGDHYITLAELAGVGAVLGAPVYVAALAAYVRYLRNRGVTWSSHRAFLPIGALLATGAAYLLSFAIWVSVPYRLMDWPGSFGPYPFMFLGVVFVPALFAVGVIYPAATWGTLHATRRSPTRR